jgi:mannose-6-phosphate isomerase class I
LNKSELNKIWRKTSQILLPDFKTRQDEEKYDIYPSFKLNDNQIFYGFDSIAAIITQQKTVIIDGYAGVFYDHFREKLHETLTKKGYRVSWKNSADYLKPFSVIQEMISPFTGGDDPLFGKRTTLNIRDFFDVAYLKKLSPDSEADINIIIGPGAVLSEWNGLVIYIDIPKNEIQFRSRAGSITNFGAELSSDPKVMYKQFYFIDWVVLNKHKKEILPEIDIIIDSQRPETPAWMKGDLLRHSLSVMSHNAFRARPWFEPGVWGGTWIKDHIEGLNKEVPNYAWSFELIVPENGLLFESSGRLLEVSFDSLMYLESEAVLGQDYSRFGNDFPIRFDFLDTFNGGNLSVQCHPRPDYMRNHFGEDFTQEETYYILDTKEDAVVYLGFTDNIDPVKFRDELEHSYRELKPMEIEQYVQKHRASKHDLFLIPYGTIHGSGKNNLVLEISSTPYIFTFKMYDWHRKDLDGNLRPLNIQRGMDNLFFERKGQHVKEKLISEPIIIAEGNDFRIYHLPTHETHLYDVHRLHFNQAIKIHTINKCHVMSLVEGSSITVRTGNGLTQKFNYAETFIIPAAAGSYEIINNSDTEAIVIKAFVK